MGRYNKSGMSVEDGCTKFMTPSRFERRSSARSHFLNIRSEALMGSTRATAQRACSTWHLSGITATSIRLPTISAAAAVETLMRHFRLLTMATVSDAASSPPRIASAHGGKTLGM